MYDAGLFVCRFMPCLKVIIENAVQTELKLLRGKTIECVSLIGLAVGMYYYCVCVCVCHIPHLLDKNISLI